MRVIPCVPLFNCQFLAVTFAAVLLTSLCDAAVPDGTVPSGYTADLFISGLSRPRGLVILDNGDMIVVEKDTSSLTLIDKTGTTKRSLYSGSGLNHGIIRSAPDWIYASSATHVYRWSLTGLLANAVPPTAVIEGIPSGGHWSRTLVFDSSGNLYVSVGSLGNVDADSSRARIRRFSSAQLQGTLPINFNDGEVFADGLRNEVGLAFDSRGRLWGVENGADRLSRSDLGDSSLYNDNPAEELNVFTQSGKFYGYPYCFSEYKIGSNPSPGKQYAWPTFLNDGTHTDTWCQDTSNVIPPAFAMQAHSAPLGIIFYPSTAVGGKWGFPSTMGNQAIISFHGSWNRQVPTGYKVVVVSFDAAGNPTGISDFFHYSGTGDTGGAWNIRPVEAKVGIDGELYVTSDTNGSIYVIKYTGASSSNSTPTTKPTVTATVSPSPSPSPLFNSVARVMYSSLSLYLLAALAVLLVFST